MSAGPVDALSGGHAVVVGASLAGLRAAEAARRAGFSGRLTLVGAEPCLPYDRPPLSKAVLTGRIAPEATTLPQLVRLDAEWRLGIAASGLDRTERVLHLADGARLDYDRLLIATGTRARPWPNERERGLSGLHAIRDRDDAARLRAALTARPERVVIVGGGFIGCEVAHAARERGLSVTLVDPGPAPLARVLGSQLGSVVAARLEAAGVELRLGTTVRRLEDDGRGHVIRALLADGSHLDTSCVVGALGALRNTEWLAGSGLSFDGGGLDCDAHARALDEAGEADGRVFAAGDVARFPHPLFERRVALEHWQHAVDHGAYAGARLAGVAADAPYAAMPAFWSVQGGLNIKSVGLTDEADGISFVRGDAKQGRFLVAYGLRGRCVGAVSFDCARWLPALAAMIAAGAPFPPPGGGIDAAAAEVLPPGFD